MKKLQQQKKQKENMSPKQWLALFCFYISYLFFGASVFYHIEHELEAKRRAINLQRRIDINGNCLVFNLPCFKSSGSGLPVMCLH